MEQNTDTHSAAWTFQVWAAFAIAMSMTLGGVTLLPVDWWARGYLLMGVLFTVGSTFTLAKTTRDNLEAEKLRNRINSAKTNRILREFESEAA